MVSSSQPRSYTFYTKSTWRRKLVAWSMLFLYLTQPILVSAEVVADPKAPGGNAPQVQTTANGLPVVQITAPSIAGVSRNLYQQFSVDPSGLILNNSKVLTQTQLAGYITGNPNLANGPARIILNEVTSNNPSYLRGYTEVAGQKAEVIIANPNGIYGDGFGFINTSRAVLTTGTPVFGGSGSLDAFRVTGGQISIQGAGMNAADVDQVDLISRSVAVNAGIWAKNLNVVAGSNQVDHNTLQTQTIAGDANVPQVAVDVGQLGGMYAQKIYLVGTENGVGVNSKGAIAAQAGDVTITSAGKVLLAGSTSATGNIQVTAKGDVTNENTLYAQGNASIASQGTLENSGTLVAGQHTTLSAQSITSTGTLGSGVKTDGTLGTAGDLTLNANGTISAQGQNMAAGNLTITGAALDLANSQTYAGGNANLTSTTGDIDHSNGTMQVGGELNMNAQGVIRNDNGTINAGKMTLQGDSIRNHSGTLTQLGQGATTISVVNNLDNTAGTISTNGDSLTMQADSILNSQGQIQHAGTGTLSIQTTSDFNNNAGKLGTNGRLALTTHSIDNTQGTIVAKGIHLNAQGTLVNDNGTIASSGDAIEIDVQGAVSNKQGSIEANNGLELSAESIDNQKGSLVSLDASGLNITATHEIQNQSGTIGGNGDVNLTGQSLLNASGNVIAQGNITGDLSQTIDNANGNIKAQQNIALGQLSTNITNTTQGTISAGNNLAIKANTFDNTAGNVVAKQDIGVQAAEMTTDGTVLVGQDVNLTITNHLTQGTGGNLKANRDVNITADTVINQGNIAAVRDINLTGNDITNSNSATLAGNEHLNVTATGDVTNAGIMAGSTTTMDAKNITNSGSIVTDQLTMNANTLSNTGNTAGITANQSAAFHLDTALHNTNGATIFMGNKDTALTIHTSSLANSGVIVSGGKLAVDAQTIQSSGTLGAGVQSDGTLGADGDLVLQASGNVIATGKNLAAGSIDVTAQDINLTGAKTGAGKDVNLTATSGDINHTGAVLQATGAISLQAANAVHNDKDTDGNAAAIQGNAITIGAKSISNVGSTMTQFGTNDTNITAATILDNTGGSIVTNGTNLTIKADTVTDNQSKIIHAGTGTLEITATTSMKNTNGSSIQTNGNIALTTGAMDNTKGSITALQGIEVTGNSLTNQQGALAASKEVSIALQNGLNNQNGVVEAGKALTIQAQAIDNKNGSISSLDASGMTVTVAEGIDNTSGMIGGNGDANLTAQSLTNANGKILSQGNINADISQSINNTSGTIAAKQNITIGKTGTNILNATLGSITAGGNLVAKANTLSNTGGTMAANTDVAVTATTISDTGTMTAGLDVNLTVNGNVSNLADSNVKANRDVNLTVANVINLGSIAAGGNLNVNANTITNQTNANLQGGSSLTITAAGNVINNGNMEGDTANINAQSITNTGSIFGDNITMTANTISNHDNTTVIAATKNINLYAKTSLENKDDASIYSLGNINIAGSNRQNTAAEYIDSTGSLLNQAATIEAEGNISIYAGEVNNKPKDILTETKSTVTTSSEDIINLPGSYKTYPWSQAYVIHTYLNGRKEYVNTVTETSVTGIDQGKILSRGNLFIKADTLTNEFSQILANGRLDSHVNFFNNSGGETTKVISTKGQIIYSKNAHYVVVDGYYWNEDETEVIPIVEEISVEKSENSNTIFGGGKEVSIHSVTINNQNINSNILGNTVSTITPGQTVTAADKTNTPINSNPVVTIITDSEYTGAHTESVNTGVALLSGDGVTPISPSQKGSSEITLPTSKLYTIHPEPNQKYLVETNPRFTNYKTFISSDYMLNSLSIQPELVEKRLGDGFYEQKLIQEQIINLTGRSSLGQYESDEEEYKALMNSGVTYAKEFNLQVGVALTPEQMAQLTSDMVWLVEKEVEGQKVLVPEVYLSQVKQDELKSGGALIAADKVEINASGDLTNTGNIKASTQSDIVAGNIINIGGTIDGGKIANITAVNDIVNQSGILTGGQLNLTAGGDIKNKTLTTQLNSDNYSTTFINQTAKIEAKDNLTVKAGRDIQVIGADIIAGQDANISAGRNLEVGTIQNNESMNVAYRSGTVSYDKTTNIASNITAGGKLDLTAVKDISLTGTNLNSKQDMNITSDKLTVTAAQDTFQVTAKEGKEGSTNIGLILQAMDVQTPSVDQVASEFKGGQSRNYSYEETKNVGSTLGSDASININTKGDTLLSGVTVDAGENFKATVEGNLTITATKDNAVEDYSKNTYKNSSHVQTADETTNASTISAKKDVTLDVKKSAADAKDGSLAIQGSYIVGDGTVNISADNGVTIEGVTERHESLTESRSVKSGFLSKKVTETSDHSVVNEVVGSTISSDTVSISSGNDLTVKGSNVVGTNDVSLTATKDVNITSAAETGTDDHYSYTKKSGLFSGGGLGFTIGSQSTKTTTNEKTLDQVGSTIGSIDGSVSVTAHNDVNSAGTTFVTGKDLNITGKDVTIDNTVNTVDSQTKYEFKQSGLSVSLGGGIVDTATSAYNNIERSGQVEDDRLKTLYDYKAYKDLDKINDQLDNGISKENLKQGVSVSASIGSTKTTTEQTTHTETVNTSNINAGGNVNITATAGDVNLIGTNINATDVTLDAKNNINIESAENKMQTDTNTSSSSWSLGASIGLSPKSGVGYFGNFTSGKGNENEDNIINSGSVIDASGTLTIKSGNDTNINGSQVIGDKVIATIDGNLNIASKQDIDNYTANNQSMGLGFTTGDIAGSRTGSFSKGNTNSIYASVTDQAGIFAGIGGFNINVGKNTDLKGAVIFGDATADKNKLSTDTITYSNIENNADYRSSSFGVNSNTNGKLLLTPLVGMPSSGEASSTTQSSISPGTIEVRSNPNSDLSELNRDPNETLNALDKIFDKKTVKEQQELAQMFGEVANDLVGKIASQHQKEALDKGAKFSEYMDEAQKAYNSGDTDKAAEYVNLAQAELEDAKSIMSQWGPGGTMKILLHTVVGGITADLSGSNVIEGAVGDGTREASRKILTNLSPEEREWAAIVIGGAVGGTTGAGTGILGAKHNHDIDNIFDNSDYLAWAMFGRENEASKDRLFSDAANKKVIPLYLSWCQQTTDVLGAAGIPFKYAFEVQKNLYEHYDDPKYDLKQANIDAALGLGLDLAESEAAQKGSSYIAQKYNLPPVAERVLEQIMSRTLDVAKEKAQ